MSIIGIDLGTTHSLVSVWEDNKAKIIPNALGSNLTPSVVGLDIDGNVLVGQVAKERLITHPELTTALFKRHMGTNHTTHLLNKSFTPADLSSLLLRSLKADAEAYLGHPVTEAVISVPAYFNDQQRKMTKTAGELAGLKVERLINEPTAAAIAYGIHELGQESTFLVFDLGGGTFDVSVLNVFDGVMEVTATAGHNSLGGEDFVDLMITDFLAKRELMAEQLSATQLSLLRARAEYLKRQLTKGDHARSMIHIDGVEHLWQISREEFETLSQPLIQKMRQPIERVLSDSGLLPRDLQAVVLVGGATRMPLVSSLVERLLGFKATGHLNPDEIVAMGAAIQAGLKARDQSLKDVILTDVCPYTLGIETSKRDRQKQLISGFYAPIIERNTVIPASIEDTFYTCHDGQRAIQVDVYQGESRHVANNLKLGELTIPVPAKPAGEQSITVRFTYDINGILEVDVKTDGTQDQQTLIIKQADCHLSEEEIQAKLEELAELKVHPRERQENRYLIARGERLYEQNLGAIRDSISHWLLQFEQVLEAQNPREIERARKQISQQFDQIDFERI